MAPEWVGPCLRLAGEVFCPALVLRRRDGTRTALSYSYLSAVEQDPQGALHIRFVGHDVAVQGLRLSAVFDAVASQRAWELAESLVRHDEDEKTPLIQTIAVVAHETR